MLQSIGQVSNASVLCVCGKGYINLFFFAMLAIGKHSTAVLAAPKQIET